MYELLLDDEARLPASPTREEQDLVREKGAAWLERLDEALLNATSMRQSKVAMVVSDGLEVLDCFPPPTEAHVELATRRVRLLCERGVLVGVGNLDRPRWSEVRLPRK